MRFMVLVKGNRESEAGTLPDEKILAEMGKDNELREVYSRPELLARFPNGF